MDFVVKFNKFMDEEVFDDDQDGEDEKAKDEIKDLIKNHYLDKDEAEHIKEIMDEYGFDEDFGIVGGAPANAHKTFRH